MRPLALALLAAAALAPFAAAQTTIDLEAHDGGGEFWFTLAGQSAKNPPIKVEPGAEVTISLKNAGAIVHNFVLDAPVKKGIPCCVPGGGSGTFTFTAPAEDATIEYWCDPHRAAGMKGTLVVGAGGAAAGGSGDGGRAMPDLTSIGPGSTLFGLGLAGLVVVGIGGLLLLDSRRPGQASSGASDEE